MMLSVRPNKAGRTRHLTVLISTQQCFLHTQTRSRLINPPCCWHTCTLTETQPLNLLFITTNDRFMNALKMTHKHGPTRKIHLQCAGATMSTYTAPCPVPPRLDWSPERLLLLPAACAALSASPAPTEPASTPDGTLQPAGTSEQTAMGSKPPVIFERTDWDSLTFDIVLVLLVWDLSAFVGKTQFTGIKLCYRC